MVCVCVLGHVQLFATPWTVTRQAPPSMGFSRQEYWRGLPFPPPGDLPDTGIKPVSPALAGGFFTTEPPERPLLSHFSRVPLSATPRTVARQAPPSMGFSRQEHWSGGPHPLPGDLPHPGIELESPEAPALAGRFFTAEPPGRPLLMC